ncbi:MAG: ComF family protein [Dethiobacteria bacterium]|nr:ComF family protein [Bacillota bacterium]HOP68182.1 ComF family protein [Bacillota bacterium]HPT33052.1 ComF family protein [Bacillota bacterium]HPZ64189.1 ComF family protein [Bacillota bacterium]HQD05244.1 ComF family protein [Bacillota bacterium]
MEKRPAALHRIIWGLDPLLDFIFPPRCLLCRRLLPGGSRMPPLCDGCLPGVRKPGLLCPYCLQPAADAGCRCGNEGPLKGLFALLWYEGDWRRLLHRLKYGGQRRLARPLGQWLARSLQESVSWPLEAVVPLPLHHRRLAERGFNQSLLLARQVARVWDLPVAALLRRERDTPSQTGLSRSRRRLNVQGAFAPEGHIRPGSFLLLVDDIYSTGATLKEAASVLHGRGAAVYAAVVAYNRLLYD